MIHFLFVVNLLCSVTSVTGGADRRTQNSEVRSSGSQ